VRVSQMLLNLLQNASKFSADDSIIELTVTCEPTALVISVKDSGVGIPAAELEKIFESFVQVGPGSGQAQGLGLGLALVRKLAQLHGGSVHASSEGVGCGAEFVLRLPFGVSPRKGPVEGAAEGAAAPAARIARRAPAHAAPAPLRLLVVDDNDDAAQSLALLLQMDGHEAATAHDGCAALRIAAEQRPDFVFLDVGLPDMSGLEVAVRLRRLMQDDQPVLVALTGWGSDEDRQRCAEAGFDAHLTKPITGEQLAQALTLRSPARVA
jgi:CheY-like chemotaxis protein